MFAIHYKLTRGRRLAQDDSIGRPAFSEIGFMSGISQTDWSWCPLITDFDNDGYRDLIVTNGFPRDVSDHDFIAYRKQAGGLESTMSLLNQIPQVKIHNYAFHNKGDLTFKDVTSQLGAYSTLHFQMEQLMQILIMMEQWTW